VSLPSFPAVVRAILHDAVPPLLFLVPLLLSACAEAPPSNLPPSASDVVLLKTAKLCDTKDGFLRQRPGAQIERAAWGSGEELRIRKDRSESGADEAFFFDEDGLLVGAVFAFPTGLKLKPYPVLRDTLEKLRADMEFYLRGLSVVGGANIESSFLYRTGDERSTTQYITLGEGRDASLLLATMEIDPYALLLSPYRPEFLSRVGGGQSEGTPAPKGGEAKQPFAALQQFARGQTAQLAYCGVRDYAHAADAYRKAIAHGLTDKIWLAEAHHRLGVALEGQGKFDQAKAELQESLTIRPNVPEVLNNLGTVYAKLRENDQAIAAFEKAVTLRPNYPRARFNLAEAYEAVNGKRAISEYETYLALVEGLEEEEERAAKAKQRIKALGGK
jgi:tetratricopeptide (TPR) repeat protein